MRAHYLRLLASTAFATGNLGYRKSAPSVANNVGSLEDAVTEMDTTLDADALLKRAPDMAAMVDYWDKTDAIVEGEDAVKAEGSRYLPMFADETKPDYEVRLSVAKFTNIYRDMVESLAAKPFEDEIKLADSDGATSPPEEIVKFTEDVDGAGNNITVFSALTFFNAINSAIDWIFVDHPTIDNERIRTKADQKAAGIRPFWMHVLGRNVYEARTMTIDGNQVLSYIRIFEPGVTDPDRVRIFQLINGKVHWQLWAETDASNKTKREFALEDDGILSIDEIPLVPIITGRRDGSSWKIFPAMKDAADLQMVLYRNESALEWIATMAGYPMLAANGMMPELEADGKTPKKVRVGPNRVLYSRPNKDGSIGSWGYVEPSAQSMTFLQNKIKDTKQDLRELGRQPLTANSGQLTVITTAYAAGKSKSAVVSWALALKDALENALVITNKFMNTNNGYDPEVIVYTEFDEFLNDGKDLEAIGKARENGDLSQETYWAELQRRRVLSPEFDGKIERKRILAEIPNEDDLDLENPDDLGNPKDA